MPYTKKGMTMGRLWRDLLGRQPGTVPGEPEREPARLSPEESVAYMRAWLEAKTRA